MSKVGLYKNIFEELGLLYSDSGNMVLPLSNNELENGYKKNLVSICDYKRAKERAKERAENKKKQYVDVNDEIRANYILETESEIGILYGTFCLNDNPSNMLNAIEKRNSFIDKIIKELKKELEIEKELAPETTKCFKNIGLGDSVLGDIERAEDKKVISYKKLMYYFTKDMADKYERALEVKPQYKDVLNRLKKGEGRTEIKTSYNIFEWQEHDKSIKDLDEFIKNYEKMIRLYENKPKPKNKLDYIKYISEHQKEKTFIFFLNQLQAYLPESAKNKHSYIVAKSGSGKSELIKSLIFAEAQKAFESSRAVILIDPHGDLAEETAKLYSLKNRVVYIDPFASEKFMPSINPFYLKKIDEHNVALMTQELRGVLSTILNGAGTTAQMDAILTPCISTLLWKGDSNFKELQRFFDDKNNEDLIELGKENPNPEHSYLFESKFNDDSYRSTKHGIFTRIQILLNDPIFQRLISNKTTIDLEELVNQKKIIIFKLPMGQMGPDSVPAFGRFIVGMVKAMALKRASTPVAKRVPIDLYIDEFQNFVSPDIEVALTQLRKYGLYLTLAHQFVGQGAIDPSLQKALFSSGIVIVGMNEKKTLSMSEAELGVSLSDLQSLKVGEFYIKSSSHKAFKFKASTYLLNGEQSASDEKFEDSVIKESIRYYYEEPSKPRIKIPLSAYGGKHTPKDERTSLNNDFENTLKKEDSKLKPKYDL